MNSPRHPPILFQPKHTSAARRLCRATVPGVWLLIGLSKLWNRKARRLATVLTGIALSLLFGDWPVQAVAIVIFIITLLWVVTLSDEVCPCL